MIIRVLGENVKGYLEIFQQNLKGLHQECPICHNNCNRHGTYRRYIVTDDRKSIRIPILRLYCKHCKTTHAVIPHFIRPYSPYPQIIHERVLTLCQLGVVKTRIAKEYGINRELIRFWQKGYHERAQEVSCAIESEFQSTAESHTDSWWCYLQTIVGTLMRETTGRLG